MKRARFAAAVCLLFAACESTPPAVDASRDASPVVDASDDLVDAATDASSDATDATDDTSDVPVDLGPPPDRIVTSCDEVTLAGAAARVSTPLGGWPLLYGEARGADLVFRAPAVARPTIITTGSERIRVDPRRGEGFDIAGLAHDCGSFRQGVASGDPRPDGVTLWTRWTAPAAATSVELSWVIATDPTLATVVTRGTVTTNADADWTVHVDAAGLSPGTTYYYRFTAPDGDRSALGRTRTAPTGAVSHLRFAVASCSSLYSGWFNAYRRIAERDDVDLMVHLGDYIYDFVDEQERVRVPPSGAVEDLTDLASFRRRHAQYLADPDLRVARQAHPWFLLWDNHDLARSLPDYGGSVRAFREWSPLRPPAAGAAPDVIYRTLRYGDLVDLVAMDMYLFRGRDPFPGDAGASVLGNAQYAWFTGEMRASRAAWRVIPMQEVLGEFGPLSGWQDFPQARTQLIDFFRTAAVVNNVFVSGDSHFTTYQDVVNDPQNMAAPYDPATGRGSVGAEFLPTSITRGNFDESLRGGTGAIIASIRDGFLRANPHQVDLELTSHGYGIVDVRPERVVNEVWYSPILAPADAETFGGAYAVRRGANRFDRTRITTPSPSR